MNVPANVGITDNDNERGQLDALRMGSNPNAKIGAKYAGTAEMRGITE